MIVWSLARFLADNRLVLVSVEMWDNCMARVKSLEQQNAALLDRVLIERGHLPIERETRIGLDQAGREAEQLWERVMAEETGVDPPMVLGDNAEEVLGEVDDA